MSEKSDDSATLHVHSITLMISSEKRAGRLEQLEQETFNHVHLENNVLFKRL